MSSIKVLIADDHLLFAAGLRTMLSAVPSVDVVAVANDGEDLLYKLESLEVDIVLLDIQMPVIDGIAAAEAMRERFPSVRVIVVSMYGERTFVERMFRVGVSGYLLKNTTVEELVQAIEKVHAGKRYFTQEVTSIVLGESLGIPDKPSLPLTKREVEILSLIAKGLSNAEAAANLHLSPQTVSTHRKNIMQKLGVNNAAALVRYAMLNGLVD